MRSSKNEINSGGIFCKEFIPLIDHESNTQKLHSKILTDRGAIYIYLSLYRWNDLTYLWSDLTFLWNCQILWNDMTWIDLTWIDVTFLVF